MAIIYTYPSGAVRADDLILVSEQHSEGNPTKNISVSALANFLATTGTGTGTTEYIVKWTDGPNGLIGDSPAFTFDGGAGLKQFILTDGYRFVVDRDAATTVGDPEYAITQNGVNKTSFGWDDDGGGFGFIYNWAGKGFKLGGATRYPQFECLTDPDVKNISFANLDIQETNPELKFMNSGGGSTMLQIFNGPLESDITHSATGGVATQIVNRNNDFYIKQRSDSRDIIFQADNGENDGNVGTYFLLDGSMADIGDDSRYTRWPDNSRIALGNSTNTSNLDFEMWYDSGTAMRNGSGGNWTMESENGIFIKNEDASEIEIHNDINSDLTLRSEGNIKLVGSGFNEYLRIDSGSVQSVAYKDIQFRDNIKAKFGASSDLSIYHNTTDSILEQLGSGNLNIEFGSGDKMISCIPGDAVELYHDATKKLETTATGVKVTEAGDGITLVSPDGLTTRKVTIDNAGNLVVA